MSLNRAAIEFAAMLRRLVAALVLVLAAAHAHMPAVAEERPGRSDNAQPPMDRSTEDRVLALDPANISAADVRDVLAHTPAPRIITLQGSVALITMEPFAEYLAAMGYPEARLKDPRDGSLSQGSFADSAQLAGTVAWYYETEGMMPMLIGHSQGG
ncbi:MAG: hypothetical protein QOG61_1988, partial [Candidatus Binataceae bacterium]|nr:hypothetical protein [Candidatus Binataceae bacterium]